MAGHMDRSSRPAFIFSYNADDEDLQALASSSGVPIASTSLAHTTATSSRHAGLGSRQDRWHEDNDFPAYGPTTHRRGPMRFVPAKEGYGVRLGEGDVKSKGKGRRVIDADDEGSAQEEEPRVPVKKLEMPGTAVRGLYESIVGVRSAPATTAPSRAPSPPPPPPPPRSASTPPLEPDLILSSDPESEPDDDLIILDPLSGLPEPPGPSLEDPPPPLQPRTIHELLADAAPSDPALVPPLQYGIHPSNPGYRMLAKQGWKEGHSLGPEGEGDHARGLKVPLRPVEKHDRKGLGLPGAGVLGRQLSQKDRDEERKRLAKQERERRGKGARGMARIARREERHRKAMIAYMNQP
ncbi:hypothetical protein JCM21900_001864 [Sporobolomyces salmonicolor]